MSKMETLNHCHVMEEKGWLFHSEDTCSTEDEYLHLLFALVFCLKPDRVLETGSYRGIGTVTIARALARNGIGHLYSLDNYPECVTAARSTLKKAEMEPFATVIEADSMDYLKETDEHFDFAFFDSMLPLRCKELKICLDRGLLQSGSMCALHDTSRVRTVTPGHHDPQTDAYWEELESIDEIKFLEFPLSRGLTLAQVK